jgi:hypothetical protein
MAKKKDYKSMTRAERRVAIAQDVIQQIQLGHIRLSAGSSYLSGHVSIDPNDFDRPIKPKEARLIQDSCTACAKGSLMISKIAKFNKASFKDIGAYESYQVWNSDIPIVTGISTDEENTVGVLSDAFSSIQLDWIEAAYEGWMTVKDIFRPTTQYWIIDHPDPYDRLLAICQNIVDHKGTFKPSVRYDVVPL